MALKLCPGCNRHARAELAACPFCGRDMPTVGSAKVGIGMALGVALVACGPSVALPDAADGTTTMASSPGSGSSAGPSDTEAVDDAGFDTGSTTIDHYDSCGDSCCGFYGGCWDGDVGGPIECDVIGQDCAESLRCAPWSNNGDSTWNATKCTPLHPRPRQLGEACSVEGSPVSGVDHCDVGLVCFGVDTSTNEGKCVELCDHQGCSVEGMTCIGLHEGFIGGCFEPCDLLAPECGELEGCYPFENDEAGCASDGSGDAGRQGDECVWVTDCAPGFVCVPAEQVAGDGAVFVDLVCTALCDPGGEEPCGEVPELQCIPLSGDPSVGACRLP